MIMYKFTKPMFLRLGSMTRNDSLVTDYYRFIPVFICHRHLVLIM